jgi:hypothetical protein
MGVTLFIYAAKTTPFVVTGIEPFDGSLNKQA